MSQENPPRLWSDFDGTAVRTVPKYDPRNWSKYPLPVMPGYNDFLMGVRHGGVEVMGIVSRRPNISPRRVATRLSIARLGITEMERATRYDHWFLQHRGSEKAKATFVADEAVRERVPHGFIDDKPHKFGIALVDALCDMPPLGSQINIQLGVVEQPKAQEYADRFLEETVEQHPDVVVSEHDGRIEIRPEDDRFRLGVTLLEPYSFTAGLNFAAEIVRPR